MKKNVLISLKLSAAMLVVCAVLYSLLIGGVGKMAVGSGKEVTVAVNGKVVGDEKIGQEFNDDHYFWGRSTAVEYNADVSASYNKGPSNPDYLRIIQARIDSFLVHNPGIKKEDIPADLVTASGSGLDPHISPASAYVQVKRVATIRQLPDEKVKSL